MERAVSISWARFCLFKRNTRRGKWASNHCFNLLSEILFVQANHLEGNVLKLHLFQSLERDSVCSSQQGRVEDFIGGLVSISWARFCLFKQKYRAFVEAAKSGFNLLSEILFVQARLFARTAQHLRSFNLLSEILFVQASTGAPSASSASRFQSLERDSVCSSLHVKIMQFLCVIVSISWARFCLFKRRWRFGQLRLLSRFNLLSEILFVQASTAALASSIGIPVSISWARFCLFKLDKFEDSKLIFARVSISWARFCLFKLWLCAGTKTTLPVSISWARFCLFKLWPPLLYTYIFLWFQSLERDSVCSSSSRPMVRSSAP